MDLKTDSMEEALDRLRRREQRTRNAQLRARLAQTSTPERALFLLHTLEGLYGRSDQLAADARNMRASV